MKRSVAVLGATGVVGQKVIALLEDHPRYRVSELAASEARIHQRFEDACDWRETLMPMPERLANMRLIDAHRIQSDVVISCLPAESALVLEPWLAEQGKLVFSNASAFRMDPCVPLLVPEVNPDHLNLLPLQKTPGKMITNPNCSAVGIVLALAPLMQISDILHVSAVTLQSVSGAGYPGIASLDILGNTIPHIPGESGKIVAETKRILGDPSLPASFGMTCHVHRVPVVYGHSATLHVTFARKVQVQELWQAYQQANERHPGLYVLHRLEGRPQPIKDLAADDMRIHIGHVQGGDDPSILGLVVLSHNLVRGAAGAVIANMDGYFHRKAGEGTSHV